MDVEKLKTVDLEKVEIVAVTSRTGRRHPTRPVNSRGRDATGFSLIRRTESEGAVTVKMIGRAVTDDFDVLEVTKDKETIATIELDEEIPKSRITGQNVFFATVFFPAPLLPTSSTVTGRSNAVKAYYGDRARL